MAHNVTLSWVAPVGGDAPTSYNVHRATASAGPFAVIGSPSVLTFIDSTVSAGITYWYEVTSVNSAGESGPSNEVNAVIPVSLPAVPTGLVAVAA
jgi:fibronectin type 3 domain-containing protein